MQKKFTSLGLMSGTSGDGVDASIILTNGLKEFEVINNKFFEYDSNLYKDFHALKEKIFSINDLKKFSEDIKSLERKITLFHAKVVKELNQDNQDIIVGFHGQTIYHNSIERISRQLGDGKLLFQLTRNKIIYNFRQNDILNQGEGAPLTPVFHQLLVQKKKIDLPVCILNIGGISNITIVKDQIDTSKIYSKDIGPGNCLIDSWVRKNSKKKFDSNGLIASTGNKNEIIFEQAQELYLNRVNKDKLSFDTNDFDISFARGLSFEDGAATLTYFTASIIGDALSLLSRNESIKKFIICGGGRKNKFLLKLILENLPVNLNIRLIDDFGIDGDFVESQAFAYLAVRSFKKLPLTFPNTTNCKEPCSGGDLVEN